MGDKAVRERGRGRDDEEAGASCRGGPLSARRPVRRRRARALLEEEADVGLQGRRCQRRLLESEREHSEELRGERERGGGGRTDASFSASRTAS